MAENKRNLMENKKGMVPRNQTIIGTNSKDPKQGGCYNIHPQGENFLEL